MNQSDEHRSTLRFSGRVVLIIGGNSGIGRASAEAFAREGAKVIITGRDSKTLTETAASAKAVMAVQADVTDIEATRRLMRRIGEAYGRIDVLFVNAGTGAFVPMEQVTEDFFDEIMAVNLKGPYFVVQQALPLLRAGAAVILTSSIGHCKGIHGNSVYAASKAGLRALARNFGAELVGRGIRVNCFSPGPIDTPLIHRGGMSGEQAEALKSHIREQVPMKRFGTAAEAANAVLFLASSESSFVTGIDLFVDGGLVSF
jgi:NAD(P)-dependent dehydrogenase (short-subunit alcohol dehydrogenase family)